MQQCKKDNNRIFTKTHYQRLKSRINTEKLLSTAKLPISLRFDEFLRRAELAAEFRLSVVRSSLKFNK